MVDLWQAYDKLRRNLWKTYEIHKILCKSGPRETSEQTVWIRWREPQISNQTHLFGSPTDGVVMVMRTSSTQSCAKFSCQTDTADCHQLNEKQHKLTYQRLDPGVDGLKSLRLTPKLFDWLVDALQFFGRWRRGSFSTAIVTQQIWKFSRLIYLNPCGLLGKGTASPLTKSCICHWAVFDVFEVI